MSTASHCLIGVLVLRDYRLDVPVSLTFGDLAMETLAILPETGYERDFLPFW